eukprot:6022154-Amphidinium_carterae.1
MATQCYAIQWCVAQGANPRHKVPMAVLQQLAKVPRHSNRLVSNDYEYADYNDDSIYYESDANKSEERLSLDKVQSALVLAHHYFLLHHCHNIPKASPRNDCLRQSAACHCGVGVNLACRVHIRELFGPLSIPPYRQFLKERCVGKALRHNGHKGDVFTPTHPPGKNQQLLEQQLR